MIIEPPPIDYPSQETFVGGFDSSHCYHARSEKVYDNGTKETWRGWAWNQVASRCVPGSTVGVLCGDIAADYEVSVRKGFTAIGLDIKQDCVDSFKAKGGLAVKDDVSSQMHYTHFDAMILDELGGVTQSSLMRFSKASGHCSAVVANYLRGRDTVAVGIQKHLDGFVVPVKMKDRSVKRIAVSKNRGVLAWVWNRVDALADILAEIPEADWLLLSLEEKLQCEDYRKIFQTAIFEVARKENPQFYSYKSKDSFQYFDSVAFNGCGNGTTKSNLLNVLESLHRRKGKRTMLSSKRKAAALKAVRTKRLEWN